MPLIPAAGLVLLKGDRVRYTGTQTATLVGKDGTVTASTKGRSNVNFDDTKLTNTAPHNKNLALRIPRYAPGDRVRITPRGGSRFINDFADVVGTVLDVDAGIRAASPDGVIETHEIVSVRLDNATTHQKTIIVSVSDVTFLEDHAPSFEVSDVVRVGTEVCVVRATPEAPGGLYEVEDSTGETLHVTSTLMEKLT